MDKKQAFLAISVFSFSLVVLTLPLWLDSSMPYLQTYYSSAIEMFQNMVPSLKVITTEIIDEVQRKL